MTGTYSLDLRKRVVASVEERGLSRRETAKQFDVGVSTVIRWVRRYRDTGSLEPGKIGGYKPKAIRGEHETWLQRLGEKDFTLRGLVAEFAERGLKVDYRSVWNFVHAERLSFKKKLGGERTGAPRRRQASGTVGEVPGPDRT